MVRSLWSGATGMNAQQTNVDTIANNLANVNSVGYKAQVAQFKSLLYQNLQSITTTANGDPKPTTSQVGLGVRTASINQIFTQGSLLDSASDTSFAIEGDDFTWAIGANNRMTLTNADGLPVLDTEGRAIVTDAGYIASNLSITEDGQICYPDAQNNPQPIGIQIGTFQFNNPGGLRREGDTLFSVTDASGRVLNESTEPDVQRSRIIQGYLEGSNVQVANEMVNLIVAQRAYEMNSKSITTSDSMLEVANNLKR